MEQIGIRQDAAWPSGVLVWINGYDHPVTIAAPFKAHHEVELDGFLRSI